MPIRLIVNADDFGLTPGINQAIAELHRAGVVTSATLMATGPAFGHAVALAHANPSLGVGCHVVLTDGLPVSAPEHIPTLLAPDGRSLRPSLRDFVLAVLRGRIHSADIRREAVAQIETLQRAGIAVTHLDTHKHTHVLPQVVTPLLEAAEITGIHAIRNPFEAAWSLRFGYGRPFRLLAVLLTRLLQPGFLAQLRRRGEKIVTTKGTIGISATGRLNAYRLTQLLAALRDRDGTWELVCHPGYNDRDLDLIPTRLRHTREIERQALLHGLAKETLTIGQASGNPARFQDSTHLDDSAHFENPAHPKDSEHPPPLELIHYGRLAERTSPTS